MDINGSCNIDKNEFIVYCTKFPLKVLIKDNPESAFSIIDTNKSQKMTIEEYAI